MDINITEIQLDIPAQQVNIGVDNTNRFLSLGVRLNSIESQNPLGLVEIDINSPIESVLPDAPITGTVKGPKDIIHIGFTVIVDGEKVIINNESTNGYNISFDCIDIGGLPTICDFEITPETSWRIGTTEVTIAVDMRDVDFTHSGKETIIISSGEHLFLPRVEG